MHQPYDSGARPLRASLTALTSACASFPQIYFNYWHQQEMLEIFDLCLMLLRLLPGPYFESQSHFQQQKRHYSYLQANLV